MGRVGAADPPGLLPKGCSVCSRFRWAPGLILAFIRPLISEAQQAWTSCCLGTAEVIRTHQRPLRGSQCRGEPRPPPGRAGGFAAAGQSLAGTVRRPFARLRAAHLTSASPELQF